MVNQSWENLETYININILYKSFLLQKIKKFKFLKKYIYISTPEIFGSSKLIKENCDIYNPSTPYATSKLCFELLLKNFAKNFNAPIIIARFSNFFGPGQPLYRLIPKLITCIDNKILTVRNKGRIKFINLLLFLIKKREVKTPTENINKIILFKNKITDIEII